MPPRKSKANTLSTPPQTNVSPPGAPGKPGSLGKEKVAISWKFDFEPQRVKVPSSQSLASRLEASLAPCWGDPLGEA